MSHRRRFVACSVVLVASVLAGALPTLPACGPYFPTTVLERPDMAVRAAPVADFYVEIARISPPVKPPFRAVVPDGDAIDQTAQADLKELRTVLAVELPAREREDLIGRYGKSRDALRKHTRDLAAWRREVSWHVGDDREKWIAENPAPQLPAVTVPADLPAEFRLYLQGAIAYRQGKINQAVAAWRELLALPHTQRKLRSTWAEFMIGKAQLATAPAEAAKSFARVRQLALGGCADSLGLAAASYGWEARAALDQRNYTRAVDLYLVQHATGDPTAAMSLRVTAERLLAAGEKTLAAATRHRATQRVVTAYVIADGGPIVSPRPGRTVRRAARAAWLKAAEAAGAKNMVGAERLAWAAYQSGDMKATERWLGRAPRDAPMTRWILAKLLLRQGKLDAAAEHLAVAVRGLPVDAHWRTALELPEAWGGYDYMAPRAQAAGELAVLRMSRSQYVEALDLLLEGKYWSDAAYVAERVLSPEELVAYVDRRWFHEAPPQRTDAADRTRRLLARRLTRLGRWKQARKYFLDHEREVLDAYVQAIRAGHDTKRAKAQRAADFCRAATMAREHGWTLLSYATANEGNQPDGTFHPWPQPPRAAHADKQKLAPLTADERARVAKHDPIEPAKWHFLYTAAGHAWTAAELMPDESDATALVLLEAGTWLKYRDPQAADRFYKAMVLRCGTTALGREADRLRWFPKLKKD